MDRDALMQSLGDGLFVTELSGLHAGVNGVSGEFSLLCKGQLVKGGKALRPAAYITLGGTFLGLLQAVETVYAMTIHKSQGSEFSHAAVVLPPSLSPIMTRELVYTGMTRAKRWLTVVAGGSSNFSVLEEATERQVRRSSGLRQGEL